ncbi:pleiotropic drug resistance protein, partial [Genlisea aurea]
QAAAAETDEASVAVDYILRVLRLENCADTLVGNQMIRGISGGEKKRVTTGEMLVRPARALFMDGISTGLDSSTTYQVVETIRQYVHLMKGTALVSLLQPAPETYDLFDDIVLLSDGRAVYQGPRDNVLAFFESVGFKCPKRKGVADFLQEVTSKKDQAQYWVDREESYHFISAAEFAEAFRTYSVGRELEDELDIPFDESNGHHPTALTDKKFGISPKEALKACAGREYLLMKRNAFFIFFKVSQITLMSIITITLFHRSKIHKDTVRDGYLYMGALFFTTTSVMINTMAELSMTISKLDVFYEQKGMLLYPTWAYALPPWILRIPISFLDVSIWTIFTYYAIGFDLNVGRFFKQYLLLLCIQQTTGALFRFLGAAGRNIIVATTVGLYVLLLMFATGGIVLSRENVKRWWIWGYWSSPLMYAQNAIIANEFNGRSWSKLINGTKLGVLVMESRGFFTNDYWYWIGVGASIGFMLIINALYVACLTFLGPFEKPRVSLPFEGQNQASAGESSKRSTSLRTGKAADSIKNDIEKKEGMILPFEPYAVTFDDIRYSIDMPPEIKAQGVTEDKLELLKGVSGAFRPGVLTALMGVSGAGKTTLMDVLAGRKKRGNVEGNIMISGYPKKQATFARILGYCEQNDIHSANITVYESLFYSAWLRLPQEVDINTKKMFVEEVMELIELTSLRGALVGLPGLNGLSTEQRKRLTIAVELVANPSIIFMDEPTSGLDARAAAIVMRIVKNTVGTGRTVVCSIHQPSIDIFEAFDELLLMKLEGQQIFFGPLGYNSTNLIDYFESIEGIPKISDGCNPATWMLEVTTSAQEASLGIDFAEYYKNSELYMRSKVLIKELNTSFTQSKELRFSTKYSQPFLTQCIACLWKQQRSYWQNPFYTVIRFVFTIAVALTLGSMFWNLGSRWETDRDVFNALGCMYAAIQSIGFQYCSSVQPLVAAERIVFYREGATGMYSALPYALSQFLIEIPYLLAQSILCSLILFSMIGLHWSISKILWFIYFIFVSLAYFVIFGMMMAAVTPNQNIAYIVSSFFFSFWNLFSGFIIPLPRMPTGWRWMYWLDPNACSLYGLIVSQYGDIHDTMSNGLKVTEFLHEYFGYNRSMLGVVAVIMAGSVALFTLVFAVAIGTFNFQKR